MSSNQPLKKIHITAYCAFVRCYDRGYFPGQRFGQAFVNQFYPESGEETSVLFYTEERSLAQERISWLLDYDLEGIE